MVEGVTSTSVGRIPEKNGSNLPSKGTVLKVAFFVALAFGGGVHANKDNNQNLVSQPSDDGCFSPIDWTYSYYPSYYSNAVVTPSGSPFCSTVTDSIYDPLCSTDDKLSDLEALYRPVLSFTSPSGNEYLNELAFLALTTVAHTALSAYSAFYKKISQSVLMAYVVWMSVSFFKDEIALYFSPYKSIGAS